MDLYPGKKPITSGIVTRKRSGFASKDTSDSRSQEAEFCNRVGCNGRLKYSKNTLFGFTGKAKFSRPSSSSLSSKDNNGCSSSSSSATSKSTSGGSSQQVSRRESSLRIGTDLPQSSKVRSRLDDNPVSQASVLIKNKVASSANDAPSGCERSNVASHGRSTSVFGLNSASGSVNTVSASSASTSSSNLLPNNGLAIRKNNKGIRSSLRNPQHKSISESIPGVGSKSSESNASRKRVFKERNPEGESSSSSSIERNSRKDVKFEDRHVPRALNGVTKSSSRHTRNLSSITDGRSTTARSLRSSTVSQSRMMLSNRDMSSVSSLGQSSRVKPQSPQFDSPVEARVQRPPVESSAGEFSRVSGHQNNSVRNAVNMPTTMPFTSLEHVVSHDAHRHNLDGIAEILMSLERIGQGAELTYEQLASFESNLFLGGYQWYDRHRDMRLDIDNMSYEELLALEERMGNVSTALSEEALSKCIRKSIYRNPSAQLRFSSSNESEDDVKCSVCQDEYAVGEEIGKLACDHRFHAGCIEQWLGLKNWCPICKAAAAAAAAAPSTSHFKQ